MWLLLTVVVPVHATGDEQRPEVNNHSRRFAVFKELESKDLQRKEFMTSESPASFITAAIYMTSIMPVGIDFKDEEKRKPRRKAIRSRTIVGQRRKQLRRPNRHSRPGILRELARRICTSNFKHVIDIAPHGRTEKVPIFKSSSVSSVSSSAAFNSASCACSVVTSAAFQSSSLWSSAAISFKGADPNTAGRMGNDPRTASSANTEEASSALGRLSACSLPVEAGLRSCRAFRASSAPSVMHLKGSDPRTAYGIGESRHKKVRKNNKGPQNSEKTQQGPEDQPTVGKTPRGGATCGAKPRDPVPTLTPFVHADETTLLGKPALAVLYGTLNA